MRNRDAATVYLTLSATHALFFAMITTINLVYQAEVAGLNPLQLVLVGTLLETVAFLFEAPTGVVADVYSRRLSVVVGTFLTGAGFMLEGAVPTFTAILLAQVLWGIGATFISGAQEAWIADEVGEERVSQLYLRGAQAAQLGSLVGIVLSVTLATIRLSLPVFLGGVCFVVLAGVLALVMPERHFTPAPREGRGSRQALGQTLRAGGELVRRRPVLLTILGIAAIAGMASEGFDRLAQVHFLRDFTLPGLGQFPPVVWFGVISGVSLLLGIGLTETIRRRVDTGSHLGAARALLVLDAARIVSVVVFGLVGNFPLALGAFWAASLLRRTRLPIYTAWINQSLEPRVRATVFSLTAQADALGQIAGGPIIGAIATVVSIPAALALTGLILAPALLLYTRTLRRPVPVPL